MIIAGLKSCSAYIDNAVIYSDNPKQHLETIRGFINRLNDAKWTIASLIFLGHVVGQGHVTPMEAKIKTISKFPVPTCILQRIRFLGMADYYRNFCYNFPILDQPLTNQTP